MTAQNASGERFRKYAAWYLHFSSIPDIIDKILKKVGEEATELVIAAKNPNPEEIKYELSDFLYHAMVLMVERGVTWEDITKELADR